MLNTPLIEIELQPDSTRVPDAVGKNILKTNRTTARFQFVDSDLFAKSRTSPPDQLALTKKNNSAIRPNMAEVPEF